MKPFIVSKSGRTIEAAGFHVTVTAGPGAAACKLQEQQEEDRRKLVALFAASPFMYKALVRIHDNITRWLETEQPAGPEESKAIYEEIANALHLAGNPTDLLYRIDQYSDRIEPKAKAPRVTPDT